MLFRTVVAAVVSVVSVGLLDAQQLEYVLALIEQKVVSYPCKSMTILTQVR